MYVNQLTIALSRKTIIIIKATNNLFWNKKSLGTNGNWETIDNGPQSHEQQQKYTLIKISILIINIFIKGINNGW